VPGIHKIAMCAVVLMWVGLWAGSALGDENQEARRVVEAAKAEAGEIPEQARALTRLAWPDGPITEHAISNLARDQIVGFGDHGLEALRERFTDVDGVYQADIASAIIETRMIVTAGLPAYYLPAIYDTIWFGSMDAKRLGMFEFARYRFPMATLPIIDSAYDYPRLRHSVIRALEQQGDDRARHFLGEILMEGDPEYLHEAAQALAVIGGRSIDTLRDATISPDATLRGAAIDALMPVSGVDDLTILYEYVALYPEDSPERMDLVLQRAAQLEAMMEARQDVDAASQYDER
jgi:HEAT repeat protein